MDHSGRLAAMEFVRKVNETVAKRMGLDSAQQIESTATVRYEIAGLDDEALG